MKLRTLVPSVLLVTGLVACSSAPPVQKRPAKAQVTAAKDENLDDDDLDSPGPTGSNPETEDVEQFAAKPKTRYQVIQEGFDRSSLMPSVNDFDPLDEPTARVVCYSVKAADPNNFSEIVIKQMMVQLTGTTDYGPLFPGSLDHVETRLVIGKNNGWVNSQNLTNDIRQVFDLARAPGSLVIRINENKYGIYQDIGAPAEVWIRKDPRGRLFFKVYRLNAARVRTEVFIGYCFQRSAAPNVVR
jgi:hypothetical protein